MLSMYGTMGKHLQHCVLPPLRIQVNPTMQWLSSLQYRFVASCALIISGLQHMQCAPTLLVLIYT
jgi:hypothetical protein